MRVVGTIDLARWIRMMLAPQLHPLHHQAHRLALSAKVAVLEKQMANHMKFCSCRMCRAGLHTKNGGDTAQKAIRRNRRKTKEALRRGEEPAPKYNFTPSASPIFKYILAHYCV